MKYDLTASRLREALNEKNMSAQELSELTGIGKSSISHYYNGTHKPSNLSAPKMARALEVNAMWIMGFDVPKYEKSNTEDALDDIDLITKFAMLDARDRDVVKSLIDIMLAKKKK